MSIPLQGGIAGAFVDDLLLDPNQRGVTDVRHEIAAVASSTSSKRAEQFAIKHKLSDATKAYGTYEELVSDGAVDIIYVATPQSRHYTDVLLALESGRHVLCEVSPDLKAIQLLNPLRNHVTFYSNIL